METAPRGARPSEPVEDAVARDRARALGAGGGLRPRLPARARARSARTAERSRRAARRCRCSPLYGALDPRRAGRAIRPPPTGRRKVVLATSIAETSLTIDGVRIVVDSGLARVPRYEPDRAHAAGDRARLAFGQRRSAAGPRGPHRARHRHPALGRSSKIRALPHSDTPEILEADLAGLALDLAAWGSRRSRRNCPSSTCRPRLPGPRPSNC